MTGKPDPKDQMVKLLGITKENVGDGFCGAYSLSEYEIPNALFLKHCRRVSKTEPEVFAVLVTHITKKARELLGI